MNRSFGKKVLAVTARISAGRIMTYGEVARAAGRPRAARAVGNILRENPRPFYKFQRRIQPIPCHRVIRADGKVGGYSGSPNAKARLLKREGIEIRAGRMVR